MYGIYKTEDQLLLLRFVSYRKLEFRKLLRRNTHVLVPNMDFGMKGILLSYDLTDCHLDGGQLWHRGEVLELLELWKDKS